MWICQLCQREFDDAEMKYGILTTLLQDIFRGIVTIDIEQVGNICYLCEDCNREKLRLLMEEQINEAI